LMPVFYGRRLNVCLRWRLSAQIFVRPRKTTTSAGVLPRHFLAGAASLQPVKATTGTIGPGAGFPVSTFLSPATSNSNLAEHPWTGWQGSFYSG
jgi:hypothetical protein